MNSSRWLEAVWRSRTEPGGTWIALRGHSMNPSLVDGDRLLVEPITQSCGALAGDVVVSRRGGLLVTHRLIEVRNGEAIMKGDARPEADPPVSCAALLGKVIAVRRPWRARMLREAGGALVRMRMRRVR